MDGGSAWRRKNIKNTFGYTSSEEIITQPEFILGQKYQKPVAFYCFFPLCLRTTRRGQTVISYMSAYMYNKYFRIVLKIYRALQLLFTFKQL